MKILEIQKNMSGKSQVIDRYPFTLSLSHQSSIIMYVTKVFVNDNMLHSIFINTRKELHLFVIGWARNRTNWIGCKVPLGDFKIEAFDVSNPCAHDHIDKPLVFF